MLKAASDMPTSKIANLEISVTKPGDWYLKPGDSKFVLYYTMTSFFITGKITDDEVGVLVRGNTDYKFRFTSKRNK